MYTQPPPKPAQPFATSRDGAVDPTPSFAQLRTTPPHPHRPARACSAPHTAADRPTPCTTATQRPALLSAKRTSATERHLQHTHRPAHPPAHPPTHRCTTVNCPRVGKCPSLPPRIPRTKQRKADGDTGVHLLELLDTDSPATLGGVGLLLPGDAARWPSPPGRPSALGEAEPRRRRASSPGPSCSLWLRARRGDCANMGAVMTGTPGARRGGSTPGDAW